MFRGKITPRKVLAYIDRLPSWSAFAEASAQDDELAEMYAEREDSDESAPGSPLVREWTPERAELVRVVEALEHLTALVHTLGGGKSPQPKPHQRPETALDRYQARLEDASYEYLAERIAESQARG